MKPFKQFLVENKHNVEVYHYSNHKFNSFDSSKLKGGIDEKGPGLYTSNQHEKMYGTQLHRIKLNTRKFIKPNSKVNRKIIEHMVNNSPHLHNVTDNWHEDPHKAKQMMVDSFVKYSDNMHQAMLHVWNDAYNKDNHTFIENARKHYHGAIVKPNPKYAPEFTHYIIWHEDAIKSIKHE